MTAAVRLAGLQFEAVVEQPGKTKQGRAIAAGLTRRQEIAWSSKESTFLRPPPAAWCFLEGKHAKGPVLVQHGRGGCARTPGTRPSTWMA